MQTIQGTNIPLPRALCRKPVFGDREQIQAIYAVEHLLEKMEKEKQDQANGINKKYIVCITFSGETEITVTAGSAKAAREIALENFLVSEVDDFDIESTHVSLAK